MYLIGALGGLTANEINAIAKASRKSPLPADGKSVAQLYLEQGFKDFKDSAALPASVTGAATAQCSELVPVNSSGPEGLPDIPDSDKKNELGEESFGQISNGSNRLPDETHASNKQLVNQDAAVVTVTVTVKMCKPTARAN